jgi:hypothetical protein
MAGEVQEKSAWQPETWFADQPGRLLKTSLDKAKSNLPLALESVQHPDQAALAVLAEKIENAENSHAVIVLAHQLTSRELNLLFPLLSAVATAKAPDRAATRQAEQLVDRIHLLVRERACRSLYESGWLKFQSCYPCQPIARALHLLCSILEIKRKSQHESANVSHSSDKLATRLISQAVSPNARHFISRLNQYRIEHELTLADLTAQFDIRSSLPLGNALIIEYFLTHDLSVYEGSHKLFGAAIRQAPPGQQAELLHHFFSLKKVPEALRNRYCQQIYRVFDDPAADHPVWSQVKPKDRQAFQYWVRAATIGTHCKLHPDKALLYLQYSDNIRSVDHWDDNTLLIYFRDFIIADSRQHPDSAICYNRAGLSSPFETNEAGFQPNPADPAIPSRPIEDAIRRGDFSGVISLPFDRVGVKLTMVFLDMRLKRKMKNER